MKNVMLGILILMLLVGCRTSEDDLYLNERASEEETEGLVKFLMVFEEEGYETEYFTSLDSEMLGTQRNILTHGEKLSIFEYDCEEDAIFDANNISEGGYEYTKYSKDGTAFTQNVSWMTPPRFYLYENLIVRYLGSNQSISKVLQTTCGEKFN